MYLIESCLAASADNSNNDYNAQLHADIRVMGSMLGTSVVRCFQHCRGAYIE